MNPVPAFINAPASPQVNLLPPEVAARRRQGRAKVVIAAVFVLVLGGIAAVWFLAVGIRVAAEADLAIEQDRRAQLQTELATYGYIDDLAATYENSIKAREWAGSTDVDWATHLSALMSAAPDGVTFTDMVIAQSTPAVSVSGDGTAFAVADLGSVQFTGRSATPELTGALIEALDALPGFADTWVNARRIAVNDGTGTVYWEYDGATRITFGALSGRTETEQTEVPQEVLDAITGGQAEPSPSPEPSITSEEGN